MWNRKLKRHRKKKSKAYGDPLKQAHVIDPEDLLARVRALAEPLCEYEGIELVHVEYQRESRGRILRLYIDRPQGVTLDDCARISRETGDMLDIELDPIGSYNLEVSSPGLDRPLSREPDFERFEGHAAKVKTTGPIDGRKSFKGVLSGVSEGRLKLRTADGAVAIPLREIRSARLIGTLNESAQRNGERRV